MHVVVLAPLGRVSLAGTAVGELELLLERLVGCLLDRVPAERPELKIQVYKIILQQEKALTPLNTVIVLHIN